MTVSLTPEIERIQNMSIEDLTPTICEHLERLKDLQNKQSAKGGPGHHEIKRREK